MCRDSVDLLGTWDAVFFSVFFFPFRPPTLILLSHPDEKQHQKKKTKRPKVFCLSFVGKSMMAAKARDWSAFYVHRL